MTGRRLLLSVALGVTVVLGMALCPLYSAPGAAEESKSAPSDTIAKSLTACCNRYVRGMNLENDPINYATGELVLKAVDFHETSPKLDFALVRTYRSQTMPAGSFGRGWAFNLDVSLSQSDGGFTMVDDKGDIVRFARAEGEAAYKQVGRKDNELKTIGEAGKETYEVIGRDGGRLILSHAGKLMEIRAGDAATKVERTDSGVITAATDERGNRFAFDSDGAGHVTKVAVMDGKYVWKFSYDEAGCLTRADNPLDYYYCYKYRTGNVSGAQTTLVYDIGLTGVSQFTLEYDGLARVTKRTWKDGENILNYDASGGTTTVNRKDGTSLTYEYTGAR